MKTRVLNHASSLPLDKDLWLFTTNGKGNVRLDNVYLETFIRNTSKSKDSPGASENSVDTVMIWRVPKGTKKNVYHQDPLEELLQCAIENSRRIVVEVRFTDSDNISRLYRVGKKIDASLPETEVVKWSSTHSTRAAKNEILNSEDVINVCQQFIKREAERLPQEYTLRELEEFRFSRS